MKKIFFIIIWLFLSVSSVFASALNTTKEKTKNISKNTTKKTNLEDSWNWFSNLSDWGFFMDLLTLIIILLLAYLAFVLIKKAVRLAFEIWYSKNLVYLKVTLPKADSKLDKEKETKKDFKEKIWIMSMFYKAIHKISEAWLKDTLLNFFFWHSKISLELIYEKWEVWFYITTYKNFVNLVSQHLTSN